MLDWWQWLGAGSRIWGNAVWHPQQM